MFKLPHNCTHLTCYQSNAQNSPSEASTVCEPWTSESSSWIYIRNQRSNCQHPLDHRKSKRVPEKHLHQSLWLWITTNCGKFLKRWEHQTTLPASWEICMQVKKQQLELNMGQRTGSKLGKEYVRLYIVHPAYLTYMQCTSCEMPSWMKTSWEKYQWPHICRWHHPYGRKQTGTEEPLDESERGEWKSWLKTQHSKN